MNRPNRPPDFICKFYWKYWFDELIVECKPDIFEKMCKIDGKLFWVPKNLTMVPLDEEADGDIILAHKNWLINKEIHKLLE